MLGPFEIIAVNLGYVRKWQCISYFEKADLDGRLGNHMALRL